MRGFTSWPRPLLLALALAFVAATTLYSALWMYGVRVEPSTYIGVEADLSDEPESLELRVVSEGGPAYQAGLRAGDAGQRGTVDALTLRGPPDSRRRLCRRSAYRSWDRASSPREVSTGASE